ncbi:MAG: hypothetical protein U9O94_10365 [Nanoarchaeota archaeon]|nr:hypothetical protein [Nanoarchaeota archaeon]
MRLRNILILFVLLLFLVGCKAKGPATSETIKGIHSGKDGLNMEFFENTPRKEVFERSVFPVAVRLYNEGAYDVVNGFLTISLEKDYIELIKDSVKSTLYERPRLIDDSHISLNLRGKSIEYPNGDQELISFNVKTKELSKDSQSEYHDSLVAITSCYGYETNLVDTVCIDTDVFGFKQREKVCDSTKTITLRSQGAPVAVTKLESEMIPDEKNPNRIKPRFTITVKNLGKGEVVWKDKVRAACYSESIDYKEWNRIDVRAYLSTKEESNKLDCDIIKEGLKDDGILNLRKREDIIRCTYENGYDENEGTFTAPLYITLSYGYTDTISGSVKIKKTKTNLYT